MQESEGLHLGNKLRQAHLNFVKQKMKVRLAVQTLSQSVADALDYCRDQLSLPDFKDCSGTVKFIKMINNIFDILNSRSLVAFGYKKALFVKNYELTKNFINEAIEYISKIKFADGNLVINSNRKTGFVGFIVGMKNVLLIYEEIVAQEKLLIYFPAYKISQDHLELFFSSIRSRGGWNNNPSCRQFTASYKRLIVRAEIREGGLGNCIPLEDIPILVGSSRSENPEANINKSLSHSLVTEEHSEENHSLESTWKDHQYIMNPKIINQYSTEVIIYIAGFVTRQLQKSIKCEHCVAALTGVKNDFLNSLILKKSRGGLMYPSLDVIKICKVSEHFLKVNESKLNKTNILDYLKSMILQNVIETNLFSCLKDHALENSTNHIYFLIEAVLLKYLNIRIHFITKKSLKWRILFDNSLPNLYCLKTNNDYF